LLSAYFNNIVCRGGADLLTQFDLNLVIFYKMHLY